MPPEGTKAQRHEGTEVRLRCCLLIHVNDDTPGGLTRISGQFDSVAEAQEQAEGVVALLRRIAGVFADRLRIVAVITPLFTDTQTTLVDGRWITLPGPGRFGSRESEVAA